MVFLFDSTTTLSFLRAEIRLRRHCSQYLVGRDVNRSGSCSVKASWVEHKISPTPPAIFIPGNRCHTHIKAVGLEGAQQPWTHDSLPPFLSWLAQMCINLTSDLGFIISVCQTLSQSVLDRWLFKASDCGIWSSHCPECKLPSSWFLLSLS